MYSEDCSREGHSNNDSPRLDNAGMVYRFTDPVDRAAACFPRDQRFSIQSSSTGSTSFAPQALSYGIQIARRHFLNSNVPPQITHDIMSSWRQGTQKQYNVYINKWSEFCTQRQVNSLFPTVTDILHFLHALYLSTKLVLFHSLYGSIGVINTIPKQLY